MADGAYSALADCNQVSGGYVLDGSSITIQPGISTLAACPPDSLADQFLRDLDAVAIYFFQDGDLFFDMKFDSGTLQFAP